MTLIGFTDRRGHAWHYRAGAQGGEPNHYPGAIPVDDVRRRLFGWTVLEGDITSTATLLDADGVGTLTITDRDRKAMLRPPGALAAEDPGAILGIFRSGYAGHDMTHAWRPPGSRREGDPAIGAGRRRARRGAPKRSTRPARAGRGRVLNTPRHSQGHGSGSATVTRMLRARDLLLLARRTAGMSQAELAARLGRPRSTIARWELGEMQPSYDAVTEAIAACGLQATVELDEPDPSYIYDVGEQLRLSPLERLARLGGAGRIAALEQLAANGSDAVIIGDVAGVLQGWPLTLPAEGGIEVAAARAPLPDGVSVVARPPGTRGATDLRRGSERFDLDAGTVAVASALDLLRIARARGRTLQAAALEAVLEHHRRWPDGPPARRSYSDDEARVAIAAWQTSR